MVDNLPQEAADTRAQSDIGDIQNEDSRFRAPADTVAPPPPAEPPQAEAPPEDPRAARMEALAARTRDQETQELAQERESMAPQPQARTETPAPERMIRLMVRGEAIELPESEVIARAQKAEARDSYIEEARSLLEDAKRTVREPAQQTQQPQFQQPPQQPQVDRIARAIEAIQIGEDPDTIRELLDQEITDRARSVVREERDNERTQGVSQAFDSEVSSTFNQIATDYPEIARDPVAANVVISLSGGMEGALISQFLEKAPDDIKSAFAQAGITAEGVKRYQPADAHALFRDMHLKGYQLPKPAAVILAASKTVAERFGATTPAPQPTPTLPPPVNRTERKQAINQPQTAQIPRSPSTGQFVPRNEQERATSSRADMRAERRGGVNRG